MTLGVQLRACSLVPDEPSEVFRGPALVDLGFSNDSAVPELHVRTLLAGVTVMPGSLEAVITWVQKLDEATSPQTATISLAIAVRRKGVPDVEVLPEPLFVAR